MESIPQLLVQLQNLFGPLADQVARQIGVVRRQRKLSGSDLLFRLVFGWLEDPEMSLANLAKPVGPQEASLTAAGLHRRFTKLTAHFLLTMLGHFLANRVCAAAPRLSALLARFSAVYLEDSTIIGLPAALADQWRGGANKYGSGASLKVVTRLNLCDGGLELRLDQGRAADSKAQNDRTTLKKASLYLADLSFFVLDNLREMGQQGVYWLFRLQNNVGLYDAEGQFLEVVNLFAKTPENTLDWPVWVGSRHRLPARLLAVRLDAKAAAARRRQLRRDAKDRGATPAKRQLALADWDVMVTNAPVEKLSATEALVLRRARWQIELLFKQWKSVGEVDAWRTKKADRILCEVYAKLIGQIVAHWHITALAWGRVDLSLDKATKSFRRQARALRERLFRSEPAYLAEVKRLAKNLSVGCTIDRRRGRPSLFQLLDGLS